MSVQVNVLRQFDHFLDVALNPESQGFVVRVLYRNFLGFLSGCFELEVNVTLRNWFLGEGFDVVNELLVRGDVLNGQFARDLADPFRRKH